jgi:CcmD family protein
MFENLTLIAIIIIVAWVVTLAYFFYTSRQQSEIREELDELRERLEKQERGG